jgi:hypothetical protein
MCALGLAVLSADDTAMWPLQQDVCVGFCLAYTIRLVSASIPMLHVLSSLLIIMTAGWQTRRVALLLKQQQQQSMARVEPLRIVCMLRAYICLDSRRLSCHVSVSAAS